MKAFALSIAVLCALVSTTKAEEPFVHDGRYCYGAIYWHCVAAPKCIWDDRKDARSEFGFVGPHCRSEKPLSKEAKMSVRKRLNYQTEM